MKINGISCLSDDDKFAGNKTSCFSSKISRQLWERDAGRGRGGVGSDRLVKILSYNLKELSLCLHLKACILFT